MTKNTFETFINLSIEKVKQEKNIYDNGLDLINFVDEYVKIINILLHSIYGESTSDIITDFIIDSGYDELENNKTNYIIYDSNSKDIIADCSTLDGLYEYVEKTRLELIKENFSYSIKSPLTDEEKRKTIEQFLTLIEKK